jgi:hypothetical protein
MSKSPEQALTWAAAPANVNLSLAIDPKSNTDRPLHLPRPTYASAALAFGIVLILGGVTTLIVSLVGAGLLPVALADWIKEVQHAE